MDLKVQVGQRLKECRKAKGLTQKQVGEHLGIVLHNIKPMKAEDMSWTIKNLFLFVCYLTFRRIISLAYPIFRLGDEDFSLDF